jgi:hypothetical protein
MKTNPMKKTIIALALVAGLTSFAGNAKAEIVFENVSTNGVSVVTGDAANDNVYFRLSSPQFNLFDQVSLFGPSGQTMTQDFNLYQFDNGNPVLRFPSNITLNAVEYNLGNFSEYRFTLPDSFDDLSFSGVSNVEDWNVANSFILALRNNTASGPGIFMNTSAYQNYNENITAVMDSGGVDLALRVTNSVPEPSTYALFGLGALALVVAYRRKVA